MKKTKRLLSLLTALAISASAFASLVIPASAEETTLYTMDVSALTEGDVTTKSATTGAVEADEIAKYNVEDFGTGSTTAGVNAIPALDGWGYMHYGYTADLKDGRQSKAYVTPSTNTLSVYTPGNDKANGAISFIPANVDGLTLPETGYLVYEFKGDLKSTKGRDVPIGFTKGTGSAVDSAANYAATVAGNTTVSLQYTMVHNVGTGDYVIYTDGIQKTTGTAEGIAGIYGQGVSNDGTTVSISNLTLKSTDTAPAAVEYSFVGDSNAELEKGTALVGTTLKAPATPDVQGKEFKEWQDANGEAVTTFTVGSTNTVYTAVYEAASVANISIETNEYSKVTVTPSEGEAQTVYTDSKGEATIVNAAWGEYTYKIEKKGYVAKSGTITLAAAGATIKETLPFVEDPDIEYIYYEADFADGSGQFGLAAPDRNKSITLKPIEMPSLGTISLTFNTAKAEKSQITWQLINKDNKVVAGVQMMNNVDGTDEDDTGIYVFTGWSGNKDLNQWDDTYKFTEGVKISDSYVGEKTVEIVIDQTSNAITAKCGDVSKSLTLIEDASKITTVKVGKHQTDTSTYITNINAYKPNPNYVLVSGDTEFAKIEGKTVTRSYSYAPAVLVPNEKYNWSVTDTSGNAVTGASIEDGVLSITDEVPAGKVLVKIASASEPEKNGELEVEIKDVQKYTATAEYPKAVQKGESAKLSVSKIVDALGDDVTEYFTPTWSIDGAPDMDAKLSYTDLAPGKATAIYATYNETALVSLTSEEVEVAEDGSLSLNAPAGATVYVWDSLDGMEPISSEVKTAPTTELEESQLAAVGSHSGNFVTNANAEPSTVTVKLDITGSDDHPQLCEIIVDDYSLVVDYTDDMTTINTDAIYVDGSTIGYQVTVADAEGNKIAQHIVELANVDDDGNIAMPTIPEDAVPAKVEVSPVYSTTMNSELTIPPASYDVTVTANNGARTDVYVNDQMIFNNINQGGDNWKLYNRTLKSSEDYTSNGVVIAQGSATFKYMDDKSNGTTITKVKVVKTPSIVKRTLQIFVIGDSLVANYHGELPEGATGVYARTGWGQVLQSYIKNADVINLGNSGAWAAGMYNDAFTRVQQSAQPGDIVVWESGYNDRNHGGTGPMREAMTKAANECKAMGVDVFFVTPNASAHDYNGSVSSSADVRSIVTDTNTKLIDLSKESFEFLSSRYGTTLDATKMVPYYNNAYNDAGTIDLSTGDKGLHSSYNAANCWAMIVARGLYNQGYADFVDTDYTYTFNDGTNDVTVGVSAN